MCDIQSNRNPKLSLRIGLENNELSDTPKRLKIMTKSTIIMIICIKPCF